MPRRLRSQDGGRVVRASAAGNYCLKKRVVRVKYANSTRERTMSVTNTQKAELVKDYQRGERRYRIARGPDRVADGAHHGPHRALQDPRQGSSFAARPAAHGEPPAQAPRLPEAGQRRQVPSADRSSGPAQVTHVTSQRRRRPCRTASERGGIDINPRPRAAVFFI